MFNRKILVLPIAISIGLLTSTSSFAKRYYFSNGFKPYVCYESRSTYKTRSYIDITYHGCFLSSKPCKYSHARHFGKYSSSNAAYRAYNRCRNSSPKHID